MSSRVREASINDVPKEILQMILSNIDWDMLIVLKRVCKKWKLIIESPYMKPPTIGGMSRAFKRQCIRKIESKKMMHPCFCVSSMLDMDDFYQILKKQWIMKCINLFSLKHKVKFSNGRINEIVDDLSLVCSHQSSHPILINDKPIHIVELIIEYKGFKHRLSWNDRTKIPNAFTFKTGEVSKVPSSWIGFPCEKVIEMFGLKFNCNEWNIGGKLYHIFQYIWLKVCPELYK